MVVGIVAGQVGEDVGQRVVYVVVACNPAPVVRAVLDRGRRECGSDFEDGTGWQQIAANRDGGLLTALLVRLRWGFRTQLLKDRLHCDGLRIG